MVLGQNGSGQNGRNKMVWTKWYTDKMVGQNGTDKMVGPTDKMVWLIFIIITDKVLNQSRSH